MRYKWSVNEFLVEDTVGTLSNVTHFSIEMRMEEFNDMKRTSIWRQISNCRMILSDLLLTMVNGWGYNHDPVSSDFV